MFFNNDKREHYKKEAQDACEEGTKAQIGDISKLLGAAWKALTDEEKAPYNEMNKAAKEQYKIDLAAHEKKMKAGVSTHAISRCM